MKVLVINLGWEQIPMMESLARQEHCELYGVHYNDKPYCASLFKEIATIDLRDLEGILKFADKIHPGAVISDQCDYSLFAQSLIAHRFNLPGPSIEAAQYSNNKYLQRECSRSMGIKIPDYKLCWTPTQVRNFAEKNGFPIILKPVDNRGSFGVIKIDTLDEINGAFHDAIIHSHSRTLLAEDFIDGVQITVDGYAFPEHGNKSLALATKNLGDGKQVAMEIIYPGNLPKELFKKALKYNEFVNEKLGYIFGMTHSEYMIRNNDIFLIESANRGGGVYTSELIAPYSAGINLVDQYISDCLGVESDIFMPSLHRSVVLRFFNLRPGMVRNILGWDELSKEENIIKCDLFIRVGDFINPITSDANRHGYVIYKGTPQEVNTLLQKVEVIYEE